MSMEIWEGVAAPRLSIKLHGLLRSLYDNRQQISKRTTQQISESISDYRLSSNKELLEQLFNSVSVHAELWFGTLLTETLPDLNRLEPALELARRRVHQGVSLEGFLRAYRLGTVGMWEPIFLASGDDNELHRELLFVVSPFLLLYFDAIAREMTRAFNAEQSLTREGKQKLKRNLWEIINTRPTDEGFVQFAEILGLNPNAVYCGLIVQPRSPAMLNEIKLQELEYQIEQFWSKMGVSIYCIAINNRLKIWISWPECDDAHRLLNEVSSSLMEFASQVRLDAFVGIGLPNSRGEGWRESLGQAQKAHSHCSVQTPVVHYSDLALFDNLPQNKSVHTFYHSLAKKLAMEPKLIETVNVWFAHNQHRKATASKLAIHPNTLDNRLERLANLLGGSLTEPSVIAKLHIALKILRG